MKLLAALEKETLVEVFFTEFCQNLRTLFKGTSPDDCYLIEYKYNNNTEIKRINVKQLYFTPFHPV